MGVKRTAVAALLLMMLDTSAVLAGPRCRVALSEWQPRDALQAKLEKDGWTVQSIRTDDGCYKVRGVSPSGERRSALFNPATLERVGRRDDDEQDDRDD
ncbi:PepSY domain-containing protein [Alsobacter sp. R-9]